MQLRAIKKKNWWNYALLTAGVFIFTQGCMLLDSNNKVAVSEIFFGMVMQSLSLKNLSSKYLFVNHNKYMEEGKEKLIKSKCSTCANIIMQSMLVLIALSCYFWSVNSIIVLLLDVFAVIAYSLTATAIFKHEIK